MGEREQRVMREEMEAGVHKPEPTKPQKLADAFEEEFGAMSHADADVSRMAHLLIEEHGKGLKLGIKQWGIIQRIVEHAVAFDPQEL